MEINSRKPLDFHALEVAGELFRGIPVFSTLDDSGVSGKKMRRNRTYPTTL